MERTILVVDDEMDIVGIGKNRSGYLEHTHRGTVFLDEIGLSPLNIQGKILRILRALLYTLFQVPANNCQFSKEIQWVHFNNSIVRYRML